MKYIYDKQGNKIDNIHAGTSEEIEQQYGKDIYISEINLGNKVIVENGAIRVKNNKEKLVDGELTLSDGQYINNNDEIETVQLIPYSIWNNTKKEWIYDKELEIEYLENELGTLEEKIFNKEKELIELEKQNKIFAAKKVKKESEELQNKFDELLIRYNEITEV